MTIPTITRNSEPPASGRRQRSLDVIDEQSNDMLYMHPIPN